MMKEKIQLQIEQINRICNLIDNGEDYLGIVISGLPEITKIMNVILENYDINEQFVLQVLKDIVYGVEQKDSVILRDTFRYGLLKIYHYVNENDQSEEVYE